MNEKDPERAKRLNEVYKHLFYCFGIKSKTEFADALNIQRTGLSAALNGSKVNLTDNLFNKICAAFPGVFNLDYLLTGEGTLLANETQPATPERVATPTTYDVSILIEKAVEKATAYSEKCIAILEKQVADKDEQIAALKLDIEMLRRTNNLMRIQINDLELEKNYLDKYPYPVGVAESANKETEQNQV